MDWVHHCFGLTTFIELGNPALPEDSRGLTVPGIVVRLGLEFASFPLTPSLSPRRGGALARRWKIRTLQLQSPLLVFRFGGTRQPSPVVLPKHGRMFLPLPEGEGWGEGEQDTRSLGRLRFGFGA